MVITSVTHGPDCKGNIFPCTVDGLNVPAVGKVPACISGIRTRIINLFLQRNPEYEIL